MPLGHNYIGGSLPQPPAPRQNSPETILIFAVEYKQIFAARIKKLILIGIGIQLHFIVVSLATVIQLVL